jgi:hypothetical protein
MGRGTRFAFGLMLAVALMTSIGVGRAQATNDGKGPTVSAVRVDRTTVTANGLTTAAVRFSVDLADPDGVAPGPTGECFDICGYYTPFVGLSRISGSNGQLELAFRVVEGMTRTAGTDKAGTWTAVWPVPSTFDGTWQVSQVNARDVNGNESDWTVQSGTAMARKVTIVGTHQPVILHRFSPDPYRRGDQLVQTASVADSQTGHGVGGAGVGIGSNFQCGADVYVGATTHTNSAGLASYNWGTFSGHHLLFCTTLVLPHGHTIPDPADDQLGAYYLYSPRVQMLFLRVSAAATAPHGQNVDVNGSLWPDTIEGRVLLQRLVDGSWHTVNEGGVRESGRFTVVATPPNVGSNYYRVVRRSDYCDATRCLYVGTVSRTITIRAT